MTFRLIFPYWRASRWMRFFLHDNRKTREKRHNMHSLGSLNEEPTFRLHDDADSGLFSLFNYPASPLCPPSPSTLGINAAVAVFSLSLAERTESPARDAITNYLREHTSWDRNRKYRRTIMVISRKNRRGVLPSIFLIYLLQDRLDFICHL